MADVVGTITVPSSLVRPENGNEALRGIFQAIFSIIIVAAVATIILGGFNFITAQGDPGKLKQANAMITNTLIGLIVAFGASVIIIFILGAFGIKFDIFNIPGLTPTSTTMIYLPRV